MSFKYGCFISYRHAEPWPTGVFIEQLFQALKGEVKAETDLDVFRDVDRMKGGAILEPSITEALRDSVCMVLVYTPPYFSLEHTYCAREYKAMLALEQHRLPGTTNGLIIPVVYRGLKRFPKELQGRKRLDLSSPTLMAADLNTQPSFLSCVHEIAEYAADRLEELAALKPPDLNGKFRLPTDAEILPWLKQIAFVGGPLPGRPEAA
ncbi:MAG: toll/interleukin-1 receptor domain-containing protein [Planctomycetes bacterium]|nr:toll/interleukin-1 receptor domain-containing protein [Planctomycetota bacterium]